MHKNSWGGLPSYPCTATGPVLVPTLVWLPFLRLRSILPSLTLSVLPSFLFPLYLFPWFTVYFLLPSFSASDFSFLFLFFPPFLPPSYQSAFLTAFSPFYHLLPYLYDSFHSFFPLPPLLSSFPPSSFAPFSSPSFFRSFGTLRDIACEYVLFYLILLWICLRASCLFLSLFLLRHISAALYLSTSICLSFFFSYLSYMRKTSKRKEDGRRW